MIYDNQDRDESSPPSGPSEEHRTTFLTALRHYFDVKDQGDWMLDFEPAIISLGRGLNLIVDNYYTIMNASHASRSWQTLERGLAGTVNALMRILSMDSTIPSAVTSLRTWVQPVWQRLNADSPGSPRAYIPIYASPTIHVGQAANYVLPITHSSMSPANSAPIAQYSASPYSSQIFSLDAAMPVHDQYVPTANLTFHTPMVPMYASSEGSSTEVSPPYACQHLYVSGLGMGSTSS